MAFYIILFFIGLVLLYYGAEWLVQGSSTIARHFGIRPIIIGLTVVAFGTSAPEACVSIIAVIQQSKSIALGNIIGSNIANIGLILGLSAMVAPLKIERPILKKELPIMIGSAIVLYLMCLNGRLGFGEGVVLLAGLGAFLGLCFVTAREEYFLVANGNGSAMEKERDGAVIVKNTGMTVIGLAGLVGGSYCLVTSSVFVARTFGVSELVIGMSLVAIGTSLPELATSIVASYRKESEICVGNVVGSNIFNLLFVLGIVAVMTPIEIDKEILTIHFPIMLLFSVALFPLMRTGFVLSRKEGAVMFGAFVLFLVFLF